MTQGKSSPPTTTHAAAGLSPEELAWIAGLEQALPPEVWKSLPPVPLRTFTQVPPSQWPAELREKLAPYVNLEDPPPE